MLTDFLENISVVCNFHDDAKKGQQLNYAKIKMSNLP